MHAVVLVGGFGTRLRPLTFTTPKPLLPVANVRQLDHLIANLGRAGVTDVVLALGFKPEPFFEAYPDGVCAGVNLHYAVEPEPLDTAGAIAFAARYAGVSDTFIVMNGDILSDLDVSALVEFHRAHGAQGTLHLTPIDDPSQYGVVETNADGWVTRFVEKPQPGETQSTVINAGTYVLEPSVLNLMPEGQRLSIERVVFPEMVKQGTLCAMPTNDYWIDTGRPDTYLAANLDLIDGTRETILSSVGAQAHVSASASVVHSVIGEGAQIGDGCVIVDSVILPGASVGAGVRLERSLVMGSVHDGCNLVDCVIGLEGHVPAHAELTGERIPSPEQAS
jgi:mannose-1-phosphate guanylyltransferase